MNGEKVCVILKRKRKKRLRIYDKFLRKSFYVYSKLSCVVKYVEL